MSVRALIVGAGAMGQRHAEAIKKNGDIVSAVVDTDYRRAESLAQKATVFNSVEEALEHTDLFDVGVVATPSALHLKQSLMLVKNDIPTLVEKPHRIPGQNPADLRQALRETQANLFVGMSTRHWPAFQIVHDAVTSGYLGEILTYQDRLGFRLATDSLPAWYFDPIGSGGGILVTNGVHVIDRLQAMLGSLIVEDTTLVASRENPGVETFACILGHTGQTKVSINLLWSAFDLLGTGVLITGTVGNAFIGMDGSYCIKARNFESSGGSINVNQLPFQRQWQAFLDQVKGFSIEDLEPTINLIEMVYKGEHNG